ncbi:hypothetical protein FPV67DRAFT_1662392 [Lyophyllum atratum]|nr:hypothetical protein FPV67DRAFT_1662392 [Lyophyllum atratum]
MDHSQSGEPEPHSTCELPTPPRLLNRDRRLGPRVALRALAFPFDAEEQDRWADFHGFKLGVGEAAPRDNRRLRTVMHILRRLPMCRLGSIPTDGDRRISSSAIFVTTNATPEELQRGMDVELVRTVQEVLATDQPPFWVKPCPDWHGELYLEFHRGTYASRGSIKKGNRHSDILLRDVEHVATLASLYKLHKKDYVYPKQAIDDSWEKVFFKQFHDVLPGSAIGMVYDDAEKLYAEVRKDGESLLEEAFGVLFQAALHKRQKRGVQEARASILLVTFLSQKNMASRIPPALLALIAESALGDILHVSASGSPWYPP